jgi:hypothetical protein
MSTEAPSDYDDVLVFLVRDLRGTFIARVLRQTTAAALYPHFVNASTGQMPEGATAPRNDDEVSFTIFKPSTLGMPAETTRLLLGLHAQAVDYDRLHQHSHVEGYDDWLKEWRSTARRAMTMVTIP